MWTLNLIQEDWLTGRWQINRNPGYHFQHMDTFTHPSHTHHIPKRKAHNTLPYKWLLALVTV